MMPMATMTSALTTAQPVAHWFCLGAVRGEGGGPGDKHRALTHDCIPNCSTISMMDAAQDCIVEARCAARARALNATRHHTKTLDGYL